MLSKLVPLSTLYSMQSRNIKWKTKHLQKVSRDRAVVQGKNSSVRSIVLEGGKNEVENIRNSHNKRETRHCSGKYIPSNDHIKKEWSVILDIT